MSSNIRHLPQRPQLPAPVVEATAPTNAGTKPASAPLRIVVLVLLASAAAMMASGLAPLDRVMANYPLDILVIYLALDIFSRLIIATGAIELAALRTSQVSGGSIFALSVGFSTLMFVLSSLVNNLAAVFVIAPIVLRIAQAARLQPGVVHLMLAGLIAACNLGGAATPIGDFPAIQIQTSGLAGFTGYLVTALPPFALNTALFAVIFADLARRRQNQATADSAASMQIAIYLHARQNDHRFVDFRALAILAIVFVGMIVAWATAIMPFHITAVAGMVAAMTLAPPKLVKRAIADTSYQPLLGMAAVLLIAALASATGWLDLLAAYLTDNISDPLVLLLTVMVLTAIASALVSAGPAAAAMLPLALSLKEGALAGHDNLIAVAFAGAICAGSSCFLWSATAGPALAQLTRDFREGLDAESSRRFDWGVARYLAIGPLTALAQFIFAIAWVSGWHALDTGGSAWPVVAVLVGCIGFISGWWTRSYLASRAEGRAELLTRIASWASIASLLLSMAGLISLLAEMVGG